MKTTHALFLAIFICNVLFITSSVKGQFPVGGTVGTPITFAILWECIHSDPDATVYWDFGPTATPATAVTQDIYDGIIEATLTQEVTYSTTGDKTVTCTIVKP